MEVGRWADHFEKRRLELPRERVEIKKKGDAMAASPFFCDDLPAGPTARGQGAIISGRIVSEHTSI